MTNNIGLPPQLQTATCHGKNCCLALKFRCWLTLTWLYQQKTHWLFTLGMLRVPMSTPCNALFHDGAIHRTVLKPSMSLAERIVCSGSNATPMERAALS